MLGHQFSNNVTNNFVLPTSIFCHQQLVFGICDKKIFSILNSIAMLGYHHFPKFLTRHLKCMREPIRSMIWIVYQSAASDRLPECTNQVARISFTLWKSQIIAKKLLVANAIRNQMDLTRAINSVAVEDTKNKQKQQQNQFGRRVDLNGVAV